MGLEIPDIGADGPKNLGILTALALFIGVTALYLTIPYVCIFHFAPVLIVGIEILLGFGMATMVACILLLRSHYRNLHPPCDPPKAYVVSAYAVLILLLVFAVYLPLFIMFGVANLC